jgi:transposase
MDEARVGQKGRSGRRWWMRGQRPAGRCDGRFQSAYIFAAVEPETGSAFGLVLPHVSTEAMSLFLAQFAATLEPDTHAVVVLDGAGWHIAKDLRVPDTVTLVRLPAYSPELNPVERIWLYLRERFLSERVFPDTDRTPEREGRSSARAEHHLARDGYDDTVARRYSCQPAA